MMLKEDYGFVADEASNGQIAVEKFKEGLDRPCGCKNRAYRLILMDI